MSEWREDILGAEFRCRTIMLGEDTEGPLQATLVRALPRVPAAGAGPRMWLPRAAEKLAGVLPPVFHVKHADAPSEGDEQRAQRDEWRDVDVLYVHGWSDYFFNRDFARFFTCRGARFYALDLRKYGRSLLPGQTPGYITDLANYTEEIDAAIDIIHGDEEGLGSGQGRETAAGTAAAGAASSVGSRGRQLVLVGHSTGGLVLSLYLAAHPGAADALVLNSPWLEFQLRSAARQFITPFVELSARLRPLDIGPQLDFGYYTRAQHEVGPADVVAGINEEWRPARTHAVTAGWLNAILSGHALVAAGLGIAAPVCTVLSARSAAPVRWSEELTRADSVLDVDAVARASLQLGSNLTIYRVDGALHDVFLSAAEPRAAAYRVLEEWLTGYLAVARSREREQEPRQ